MSYTLHDAAYDMYMADEGARLLYEEHRERAITEFTAERLQSYYLDHPLAAQAAVEALSDSRQLVKIHAGAALVFSAIAIEIGIKGALLRPVVYGLVHQESTASLITDLVMSHTSFDRFRDLLFQVLAEHGGIDLHTTKRLGASQSLWEEVARVQAMRNALVHRGERPTPEQAELSIDVATTVLENLLPSVLSRLGLHLHGVRVCGKATCRA
jgi:hypothetical protein